MKVFALSAVSTLAVLWAGSAVPLAHAQDAALPVDQGNRTDDPSPDSTGDPGATTEPDAPAPPPPPPPPPVEVAQAGDDERPPAATPEVAEEPIGTGARLVLQLQSNAQVGALIETPSMTGTFAFDRATLTGVPDAVIAVRLDRLTLGLGLTWTQIAQPTQLTDPCGTGATRLELENTSTLFGVLPTARYDVLTTTDGRGRMEAGITPVILFSSQSREQFTGCGGSSPMIQHTDSTDTVLGFDALLGGRYHLWPALSVGVEVGFAYLVFDFDADPMGGDAPSVRAFTFYSALTLAIELPI